jgi:ubiquinone/menaquinone biosynthesis C-methylase UbiE
MPKKVISDPVPEVDYADEYDDLARKAESHAAEIIFGMVFEYIHPEQTLLDIAIGTGLSSKLFFKAGMDIYGFDNSPELLNVCKKKNIAVDLKLFDLNEGSFPYNENQFDHVISVGVFHFFQDLDGFFRETRRIIKPGGTFSFTVIVSHHGISHEFNKEYQIDVYGHDQQYLEGLIKKYNFQLLKRIRFLSFKDITKTERICFEAYVLGAE